MFQLTRFSNNKEPKCALRGDYMIHWLCYLILCYSKQRTGAMSLLSWYIYWGKKYSRVISPITERFSWGGEEKPAVHRSLYDRGEVSPAVHRSLYDRGEVSPATMVNYLQRWRIKGPPPTVASLFSALIGVSDFNSKMHYVIERKSNSWEKWQKDWRKSKLYDIFGWKCNWDLIVLNCQKG